MVQITNRILKEVILTIKGKSLLYQRTHHQKHQRETIKPSVLGNNNIQNLRTKTQRILCELYSYKHSKDSSS